MPIREPLKYAYLGFRPHGLVDPLIPELFFFVRTEEPTFTLAVFALSLSEINFPTGNRRTDDHKIAVGFDPKDIWDFMENHFAGLNKFTQWLDLSVEDNKRITHRILRRIFPNYNKNIP
jgi:hypothetical protein